MEGMEGTPGDGRGWDGGDRGDPRGWDGVGQDGGDGGNPRGWDGGDPRGPQGMEGDRMEGTPGDPRGWRRIGESPGDGRGWTGTGWRGPQGMEGTPGDGGGQDRGDGGDPRGWDGADRVYPRGWRGTGWRGPQEMEGDGGDPRGWEGMGKTPGTEVERMEGAGWKGPWSWPEGTPQMRGARDDPGWDGDGGGYHETRTKRTPGDGGETRGTKVLMGPGPRGLHGMEGSAGLGRRDPHLLLQLRRLEGEQELLDVVLAELIDAAGVDGPAQELVHLVLGVEGLLGAAAGDRGGSGPPRTPGSAPGRGQA